MCFNYQYSDFNAFFHFQIERKIKLTNTNEVSSAVTLKKLQILIDVEEYELLKDDESNN